jgi:hypothetical protein
MAHVIYDPNKPLGIKVANLVQMVDAARAQCASIKAVMDSVSAGGVTPANLETGGTADGIALFSVASGQGSTFYSNIVSINSSLQAITMAILADMTMR